MTHDPRLADLLARWRCDTKLGRTPAPEELCRECPELLGPMQRTLAILHAMSWLEEADEPDDRLSLPELAVDTLIAVPSLDGLAQMLGSADEFKRSLVDAGVLTDEELCAFQQDHNEGQSFATALDLAVALLRQRKLTAFQARRIARGKSDELTLGNYLLLDEIGAGGMGQVYRARHRTMKRVVAVKLVNPDLVQGPALSRFKREVEALARLEHPNIVIAHDAAEAGGRHFLVMQYIDGEDLSRLVARRGPLRPGQALDCLLQAARGLEYAHRQGVIHRDIKPSNLMVDRSGAVKVLDLGLARLHRTEETDSQATALTEEQEVMGTADYMAPEQAVDTRHADQLSDIYSLGCTLHFLLTGQPVYGGKTLMARFLAHRERPIPSLRQRNPDVPESMDAIFRKMVAKDPRDRYRSMTALLGELEAHAGHAEKLLSDAEPNPFLKQRSSGDTSSVLGRDTQRESKPADPAPSPQPRRPRWRRIVFPLVALGLAALGSWLLFGVILQIQTPDGTVVVELEGKTIPVKVNGDGTLTITDPNDGKAIEVKVEKGNKVLTLIKDGFQALALEFNLTTKDGRSLKAKFVPNPAAAPDQRQILLGSKRDGNFEIYLMNLDGTQAKNLTNHPANENSPAWSPDGQKIAFASDREGAFNIYVMDADGGNVKAITSGPGYRFGPSWSPDGKTILYIQQIPGGPAHRIFAHNFSNSKTTELPGTRKGEDATDPAWSPDGKRVAFNSHRHKGWLSVYVMDADGTNIRQINNNSYDIAHPTPAWSPDGKKLAYSEASVGALEVFVRDADGKNPKQLTSLGGGNNGVAWSPDGDRMIFQHFDPARSEEPGPLYIMDADGGNQRILFNKDGPTRVAWRPAPRPDLGDSGSGRHR